jgi:3-(3-hydroxy-phenyl)propionate hydroxylase
VAADGAHWLARNGRAWQLREHDPLAAAARDEAFRSGNVPPPPPFPTLVAGVVHHGDDGTVSPHAGTLSPHGRVRTPPAEGLFDDVVGRGFSLVSTADWRSVLDADQEAFVEALGVSTATLAAGARDSVVDIDGTYAAWLAERNASVLISRPDYHLFWAGSPAELPEALDQLRARLSWVAAPAPVEVGA